MTDHSPAAQAVLDVSMAHSGPAFEPLVRKMTAAALRAAANHMAAWADEHHGTVHIDDLLAIAVELDGAAPT